ncbi:hypothetical protein BCR39DRAFT_116667 [Naematelia encephala]|uniref:Uncharacterized protein n=1 Tax=Naematelia encephala TaxID=71784 RepID=A0A1Y2BIG8_9TREE|nr:hypothetical protein BCR39DRAFT_116667 [Naematelia encephala]
MDESLRTLELMASEVGGTVLILKEVVLVAPEVSRPDRDHAGLPPKSAASSSGALVLKGRRHRARSGWLDDGTGGDERGGSRRERQVVFDQADLSWDFSSGDEDSPESQDEMARRVKENDDDVSTFHLDLDEPPPPSPTPSRVCNETLLCRKERRKSKAEEAPEQQNTSSKAEAKRLKSFQRRENRRLDLLRGDGKSPLPFDLTPPIVLPHQPARPSSLRLANPPIDASSSDNDNDHDQSDLLHILSVPLDNLSLSFADVRTVSSPPPPPSTSGSDTEHASDVDDPLSESGWIVPKEGEEERICVEALVVRKAQEDVWEFGGSEDGWGFGRPRAEGDGDGDGDGDGEVEWVGESEGGDDGWGFWGDLS